MMGLSRLYIESSCLSLLGLTTPCFGVVQSVSSCILYVILIRKILYNNNKKILPHKLAEQTPSAAYLFGFCNFIYE